jgi:phage gp16-like protein
MTEPATAKQKSFMALEWLRIFGPEANRTGAYQEGCAREHLKILTGKTSRTMLSKQDASSYIDELVRLPNFGEAKAR